MYTHLDGGKLPLHKRGVRLPAISGCWLRNSVYRYWLLGCDAVPWWPMGCCGPLLVFIGYPLLGLAWSDWISGCCTTSWRNWRIVSCWKAYCGWHYLLIIKDHEIYCIIWHVVLKLFSSSRFIILVPILLPTSLMLKVALFANYQGSWNLLYNLACCPQVVFV